MSYEILLIDDCPKRLEEDQELWKKYNGRLTAVKDVYEAVDELPNKEYVLIAVMQDHVNGRMQETLSLLRGITYLPILVLALEHLSEVRIAALTLGADQYLTIPESKEEGILCGYALIRRYTDYNCKPIGKPIPLKHNELLLCKEQRIVFVHGIWVNTLTRKEFDLLLYLMENKGNVLSYKQINENVWGAAYADNSKAVIWCHIKNLRQKLYVGPDVPEYIETVNGVGYRFIAD